MTKNAIAGRFAGASQKHADEQNSFPPAGMAVPAFIKRRRRPLPAVRDRWCM